MREPFVGRSAELAELDRQLELAEGGHQRLVLLAGPAGIGKTALIRRCVSGWRTRADPLMASGDPDEAELAGGLLSQLAQPQARAAAEVAALLAKGAADPLSVGPALLAFLHDLARNKTLLVVIDDAQWADELSLKALSFALRRLSADPVLCVIAARPDDLLRLPPGITRLVNDYGVRLDLAGLHAGEVAALAERAGAGCQPGPRSGSVTIPRASRCISGNSCTTCPVRRSGLPVSPCRRPVLWKPSYSPGSPCAR